MIRLTHSLKVILLSSFLLGLVGCSALDLDQRNRKSRFFRALGAEFTLSEGVIETLDQNDVFDSDLIKTEGC